MNKKAVSELVSYVFLVVITLAISILVFAFLKGYIIKQEVSCPESVSLSLTDYNCENYMLSLNLRNKGNFDIDALIVLYSNDSIKQPYINLGNKEGDYFYNGNQALKPNENYTLKYNLPNNIYNIEILPIKIINNLPKICSSSRYRMKINC